MQITVINNITSISKLIFSLDEKPELVISRDIYENRKEFNRIYLEVLKHLEERQVGQQNCIARKSRYG